MKRFAAEQKINYPVVMLTPELAKLFPGIYALPTSYILDREVRVVQKHVGMLTPAMTELEARSLAGLPVNASIEEVEPGQPIKLDNTAEVTSIPGLDLTKLSAAQKADVLQKAERGALHVRMQPHARQVPHRRSDLQYQLVSGPGHVQAAHRESVANQRRSSSASSETAPSNRSPAAGASARRPSRPTASTCAAASTTRSAAR